MMAIPRSWVATCETSGARVNQPVSRIPMVIRKAVENVRRKNAVADRNACLVKNIPYPPAFSSPGRTYWAPSHGDRKSKARYS